MWKTIAVVGATATIIAGAGTVAVAASGASTNNTPTASTSSSSLAPTSRDGSSAKTGRHGGKFRLGKAVHATWVSENKKAKTFTTHDAIRGHVSAVSPTSITITAADRVSETYVLNTGTKVHTRSAKAASSISDVKIGDPVWVAGTGTTTLTATRVVDTKK